MAVTLLGSNRRRRSMLRRRGLCVTAWAITDMSAARGIHQQVSQQLHLVLGTKNSSSSGPSPRYCDARAEAGVPAPGR